MNSSNQRHRAGLTLYWISRSALCGLLLGLAGCSPDATPQRSGTAPPQLSGTDIARVGNAVIDRDIFAREWERRAELQSKEELLEEMIRFESLLAKARAAGLDRDPEVTAAFHRMVVAKYQEDQLQRRGLETIRSSEAELLAYYHNHSDRFATPKQIRLGIIYCRTSAKATPEKREELRQHAETLWSQARQSDDHGFRQLALQHSDDQATRYAGGDTGWFSPKQAGARWDSAVIQAALALSEAGEVAPLVPTTDGFHIVKLLGTRAASQRPLSEVRDGIEYQLRMEKAQKLRGEFFRETRDGLAIEINRAALETIPDRPMQAASSAPPTLPK